MKLSNLLIKSIVFFKISAFIIIKSEKNQLEEVMNIKKYICEIREKILRINEYTTNPINYKDINNPFASTLPKTYVWIEEDNKGGYDIL